MRHTMTVPSGPSFVVRTSVDTDQRLMTTCFDSLAGHAYAGRFMFWKTFPEILRDTAFSAMFLSEVAPIFAAMGTDGARVVRLQLQFGLKVGWESTAPRTGFAASELEVFHPNEQTTALRVVTNTAREAPLTNLVTLASRLSSGPNGKACDIYTVYPGIDIGPLTPRKGGNLDITARTGRVFYAFEQPGETL